MLLFTFKFRVMKKLFSILLLGMAIFFQACEGPMGPEGPQGPPGLDGGLEYSLVIERTIDFTAANNYFRDFQFNQPIFESDVVLVYIEWDNANGRKIWRLLPQTVFFEEGALQYNFDFTDVDYAIFLETTFDPSILDNSWTRNQTFRIVVVPGEFINGRIDYSNYEGVMKLIGAEEKDVVKMND